MKIHSAFLSSSYGYRTSILSTSSFASFHVSRFFFAQSTWHRAYAICKRVFSQKVLRTEADGHAYHVSLQVFLLLRLEPFQVLQNPRAGVLDVLLRYLEGLLQLMRSSVCMGIDTRRSLT